MRPPSMLWADHLLDHMQSCHSCTAAKIANHSRYCQLGQELIRLTLKERHG